MLVIRDTSAVPQEKWHYPIQATGYDLYAPNYPSLYSLIVQHCAANEVEPPSEQAVIDWCCANLSVPCYESATREPLVNRFTLNLPAPAVRCCGSANK